MWDLAKKSASAWSDDYASSMGAALAYYTLFSLAPLLLLVISVAGLVYGTVDDTGVVTILAMNFGPDADAANQLLETAVATFRKR